MSALTMYRGDDKSWTVTILNTAGTAQDLTGCTVWWTLKTSRSLADSAATISHYWTQAAESGLSRTHPTTGAVSALAAGILYNAITNAESDDLVPGIVYLYDVQLKDANAKVSTVEEGTLVVATDITIRTTTP